MTSPVLKGRKFTQKLAPVLAILGVHFMEAFLGTYSWLFEPISGWEVAVQATMNH